MEGLSDDSRGTPKNSWKRALKHAKSMGRSAGSSISSSPLLESSDEGSYLEMSSGDMTPQGHVAGDAGVNGTGIKGVVGMYASWEFDFEKDVSDNHIESLDFDTYESFQFMAAEHRLEKSAINKVNAFRWVLIFVVGGMTGTLAYFIDFNVDKIQEAKHGLIDDLLLDNDSAFGVFLLWWAINVCLVAIAASLVCFLEAKAGGSGIPEIKCYLNGVRVPNALKMRTLVAKLFGVLFSVGAGLPVGKEGPMIHCGAIWGGSLSQGRNTSSRTPFDSDEAWEILKGYRSTTEKRDFIAAGASAGVAAAFGAPIGGVLFALEEGATHWNVQILWRCFFCAMWGSTFISCLSTLFDDDDNDYGLVTKDSLITFGSFSTSTSNSFNIKETPIIVIVGCFGGLFGALFNDLNERLTSWRIKHIKGFGLHAENGRRSGFIRFLEALIVISVVSAFAFWMPYAAKDCTPIGPSINATCIDAGYDLDAIGYKECTLDSGGAWQKIKAVPNRFNCESSGNHEWPDNYSPSATIWYGKADTAIKHLLHNADQLSYGTLASFFFCYFLLACWTYGIGVPSGLFVPSLLTGAAFGRIIGEFVREHVFHVDVGMYALIGAASFLAGMARITISLTVILMECSRSVASGLPIMLCVMFSKWVGDLFNVGLYDIHIELEHVPFLEPFPEDEHMLLQVEDVMTSQMLAVLPECCRVDEIINLLQTNEHSTFPVVQNLANMKFKGIIRRDYLCGILKVGGTQILQDHFTNERDAVGQHCVHMEDLMRLFPTFPSIQDAVKGWYDPSQHGQMFVDLKFYCNPEPFHMGPKASLARCFRLFRTMGLRHLTIVDENHKVCGVITRQDLLHESIHAGIEGARVRRPAMIRTASMAGRIAAGGHH